MATEPIVKEEGTEEIAAAELTAGLNLSFQQRNTRAKVIEVVKNSRVIPLVYQAAILAEIEVVDARHELIQLTVIRHPHKGGGNFTFTVCEI